MVPLAVELANIALGPVFEQLWASLGTVGYTRTVAARLANGQPPYTHARPGQERRRSGISASTVNRALAALVDKGIVARSGRSYSFREPMFERYVQELTAG